MEEILCDLFIKKIISFMNFLNSSSSSITYILLNNSLIYFWHNV